MGAYSTHDLLQIKAAHEKGGAFELPPTETRHAFAILEAHRARGKRTIKGSVISGSSSAIAGKGGVAFSFVGNNVGDIRIHVPAQQTGNGIIYPKNSIGSDANFSGYVDYLCDLYVDYMRITGKDEGTLRAMIGSSIKRAFRLSKRTRYHIPS